MWRACCGTAELFVWPENFFICLLNAGATHPSYPEQAHPSQTKFTLDQNVKPFCMLEMTVALDSWNSEILQIIYTYSSSQITITSTSIKLFLQTRYPSFHLIPLSVLTAIFQVNLG